jgi:hypothetical protein
VNFGRAFGAEFSWGGCDIRIVGGHAAADGNRVPYQKVLTTWSSSSSTHLRGRIVILGVDTQQCLGPLKAFDSQDIQGKFAIGHRDWRATVF